MKFQNLHTHSTFCDGKSSASEMLRAALERGFDSLGFSSHATLPFPCHWAMKEGVPEQYRAEVLRLKEKYAGQIRVHLGLEQDYYSPEIDAPYEYWIGGVHYVEKNGKYYSVDHSGEGLVEAANESYGGDVLALAEDYFALVADTVRKTRCQILAHLDLITRYNAGSRFFDMESPRYRRAALDALDALSHTDVIFEINTSPYLRGRDEPYPASFLLREMSARKLPIVLSTDAHRAELLTMGAPEAAELLRDFGFRELMYWNGKTFEAGPLPDEFERNGGAVC